MILSGLEKPDDGKYLPSKCDRMLGEQHIDRTAVGYYGNDKYPLTNLWNINGTLNDPAKFPGYNPDLDIGASCQGGPCGEPENKDKNGNGCWMV